MAFFGKKFGTAKKQKGRDEDYPPHEGERTKPQPMRAVHPDNDLRSPAVNGYKDDKRSSGGEKETPVSKKERNVSISRSGRHKIKNKRTSVLENDVFSSPSSAESTPSPSGAPPSARARGWSAPSSKNWADSNCREPAGSSHKLGQPRHTSTPTAV